MSFGFGSPAGTGGFGSATSGGFGAPAAAAPSSFGSFGTPAPAAAPAAGGFGSTTTNPTTPGFGGGFGAITAKPATLGGFGSLSTPASTLGGFGSPAAVTATTSFGGGGFGTPAAGGFGSTTQPTSSFGGGFGSTPAATPAAGGFGGLGGFGSAAKPAGTGLLAGFGSTTPAAAPSSSFGSFATPAATSSFGGGFGATNTNAMGAGGGGFGNTGNMNMNNYTNGFGGAVVPVSMSESVCEFPIETQYKDMPAPYKAEIDRTWKEMKQPMKTKLEEISRSRGVIFDEVHNELRRIHLAVLNVENEQRRLQSEIRPFLAELRRTSETGRLQAAIGLQQIRNQSMGSLALTSGSEPLRNLLDEDLPCKWYALVAEQLSSRLTKCIETVHNYERQLATRLQAIQGGVLGAAGRGTYGQLRRVGVQELVTLMQEQAKVFLQIAAAVAQVHKEADSMRQLYMSIKSGGSGKSPRGVSSSTGSNGGSRVPNPFEDADRKEAAEQRVLEQRIHTEAARYHQQQRQQQPQLGQAGALPGATPGMGAGAGGGGFGGGFGSTPGLGGTKLGGGFGSTPAVGATTTPGGFGSLGGFGSTPAAGGFGAPATPAAGGFGAPTTPAAGGFGAPATPAAGGFGAPATPALSGIGAPAVAGAFSLPAGSGALNAFPGVPGGTFGAPTAGMGGKSSFAALDLATPLGGSFPSIGGATTPGGPNNPNKKPSKNKK